MNIPPFLKAGVLSPNSLIDFNRLQLLLKHLPKEVVRVKGFVFANEEPATRYLLQMVGRRATFSRSGTWGIAKPQTRLVFIANKNTVNFTAVGSALNECLEQNKEMVR